MYVRRGKRASREIKTENRKIAMKHATIANERRRRRYDVDDFAVR